MDRLSTGIAAADAILDIETGGALYLRVTKSRFSAHDRRRHDLHVDRDAVRFSSAAEVGHPK